MERSFGANATVLVRMKADFTFNEELTIEEAKKAILSGDFYDCDAYSEDRVIVEHIELTPTGEEREYD